MELQQVRYFLALAQTLNFTRAAEQCQVTQPALTKAIQKLELELGGDLVYRERQLTHLTDLGQVVLPVLDRIVAATETAHIQAKEFRDRRIAPLRIGLAQTVSASLIVEPIFELTRHIPGLEVEVIERSGDQLADALLEGEVHVGIAGTGTLVSERIDRWKLFEERYVVLAAHNHPSANSAAVSLQALSGTPWLERIGCEVDLKFRQTCFAPDLAPKVVHRGRLDSHLQHMAAAGLGVMLAPEHAPRLSSLIARPIEGDPMRHAVELLVMSGRRYSPALDAFIKTMRLKDWPREPCYEAWAQTGALRLAHSAY